MYKDSYEGNDRDQSSGEDKCNKLVVIADRMAITHPLVDVFWSAEVTAGTSARLLDPDFVQIPLSRALSQMCVSLAAQLLHSLFQTCI